MNSILSEYQVTVLKSNVVTRFDRFKLGLVLDHRPLINRWTVDQEDIDHVIRIESNHIGVDELIALINSAGFECSELE